MIRIERALVDDIEKLRQVGVQAFAEDTERYGASPAGIDLIENHRTWIETYHYYKILLEEVIVGGMLVMPADDAYELEALFITPKFQSQGIGSRAMTFLEEAYPNAKKWGLCTAYLNDSIRRFYEKRGYEKVGQTKPGNHPEVPDKDFHLFLFEKRVGSAASSS
jgi:GNAT superfamily N-acetyltransferase